MIEMRACTHWTCVKDEWYNTFPSITRLSDGRLGMVYRQAVNRLPEFGKITHVDPSSRVVFLTSNDEGTSWSLPRVIYDDEMGEQDPCITRLSDGMLICTFFRWKVVPVERKEELGEAFKYYGRIVYDRWAAMHVGTMCIRSSDNGDTWDGPYVVESKGFAGPAALRGLLVELPDGRLLAPLYGVKQLGGLSRCMVVMSHDRGITWKTQGEIPPLDGKHFVEPFLYRAPSGRLDLLMRTQLDFYKIPFDQTYLNLHISSSQDNGSSWSIPAETGLFCPNPVHVLPVGASEVLVSYGQRRDPKGMEAFVTDAEHPCFDSEGVRMLRPASSGDLGYPSAVRLYDGNALVVYYMTDADQDACIACTKVVF